MLQELLRTFQIILIGMLVRGAQPHSQNDDYMSLPPLPYYHQQNAHTSYFPPNYLSSYHGVSQPQQLSYHGSNFPPLFQDSMPHEPYFDLNFQYQQLPQHHQEPFQYDLNQNHIEGFNYFNFDPNFARDPVIGVKAPIQIIPSRFPPRIEQIVERIQNYFSTYTQVDGERPDHDPNHRPPLPVPVSSTTQANKVDNSTEAVTVPTVDETPLPSPSTTTSTTTTTTTTTTVAPTTTSTEAATAKATTTSKTEEVTEKVADDDVELITEKTGESNDVTEPTEPTEEAETEQPEETTDEIELIFEETTIRKNRVDDDIDIRISTDNPVDKDEPSQNVVNNAR